MELRRSEVGSAVVQLRPLACLIRILLRKGARYQERGAAVSAKSQRARTTKMIKELRKLGYRIEGGPLPAGAVA
jgi:hypothetical protein